MGAEEKLTVRENRFQTYVTYGVVVANAQCTSEKNGRIIAAQTQQIRKVN